MIILLNLADIDHKRNWRLFLIQTCYSGKSYCYLEIVDSPVIVASDIDATNS